MKVILVDRYAVVRDSCSNLHIAYYQMHVDGGLYSNVFMIGMLVNWSEVLQINSEKMSHFDANLYVIANRKYRESHAYKPAPLESTEIIGSLLLVATDLLFDRTIYRLYENEVYSRIKSK